MARHGVRRVWLIGLTVALLLATLTLVGPPPAEARMGSVHRGGGRAFHAGFGHQFNGGFGHGFRHHPFRRNVFFFNVGVGGFFPGYPVAYPYPAYYPYPYSPCGYYDAYGRWINAPCPPYAPPVSAPY